MDEQLASKQTPVAPRPVRCAIYTRKSTEEGLDQDFNSLHAQRESAEAYIRSQKHFGWTAIETGFDDGGFSGASLERPALQRLLEAIEAGQVDCVVVYKVDRLSRSLFDFARLMERFEQRSISFVSVTQQFNTTTSLGRLTLNILLSFAQFERELIGERTRDKMGAARRKGKWVGGTPMLGYNVDPAGGRLVVNHAEAEKVRQIYQLYREHGSLDAVVTKLAERGWTNKSWKSRRGIRHTGKPFSKSTLRLLLTNPTYRGQVCYRGALYPGEHQAIVEPNLWEEVNRDLRQPRFQPRQRSYEQRTAVLNGLLVCKDCRQPMMATYSGKGKTRHYRYYVCQTARNRGWKSCPTKSVSANLLENSLVMQLRSQLNSADLRRQLEVSDTEWQALWQAESTALERLLPALISEIECEGPTGTIRVKLKQQPERSFEYRIPQRRGKGRAPYRMQPVKEAMTRPPRLARIVALGHKLEGLVRTGKVKDFVEIARLTRVSAARIHQVVMLTQLAPASQERILFLAPEEAAIIGERALRQIASEIRWDRQQAMFEGLLGSPR